MKSNENTTHFPRARGPAWATTGKHSEAENGPDLWIAPAHDSRIGTDRFFAPKAQPLVSPGQSEFASDALGKPPNTVLSPVGGMALT